MYRTLALSKRSNRFAVKTLAYSIKATTRQNTAGEAHLPDETPSDRRDIASRMLTQLRLARTHARTTRTRNETETDFPVGFS